MFGITVTASDPKDPSKESESMDVLVGTGSELTWLPRNILERTVISKVRSQEFVTATGERVHRDIGYAILRTDDFETVDEVVFGEPDDMNLLGMRTVEGYSAMVDNVAQRLIRRPALVV